MKPELFNDLNKITEEMRQLPESLMAKASSFTSGNLVVFDSNGNGYDSGKSIDDVAAGQFVPLDGSAPMTGNLKIAQGSGSTTQVLQHGSAEAHTYSDLLHQDKNGAWGRLRLQTLDDNGNEIAANNAIVFLHKTKDSSTHTNYKLYGEHNKPTASDVGALPITGGTLTGNQLWLYNGQVVFRTDTSTLFMGMCDNTAKDLNNYNGILIGKPSGKSATTNTVRLRNVVNGTVTDYNLYGEHNKPTATDVGALPSTGGTVSGKITAKQYAQSDYGNPIEIGAYIDMHKVGSTTDYDMRLGLNSDGSPYITIPNKGTYNLYGTHNKPTAADVGAIPLSGGKLSSATSAITKAGSSTSWYSGRDTAMLKIDTFNAYNAITSMKTTKGSWEMGVYTDDKMYFTYIKDSDYTAKNNVATQIRLEPTGVLYGAAWNDYAEYRIAESVEPGRCVIEDASGSMKLATERLQPGAEIISDTFGFAIGETESCKTPIAAAGRVLAYTYEDRNSYPLGAAVCSGPNGTVSLMTREEIKEYPERIIGTVSEIPDYETWGQHEVAVNGRIWIRIK